jgi:hypothetical protein
VQASQKKTCMKKLIIVLAVGMITAEGLAQGGKKTAPPPPPQEIKDVPIAPPPPPPPVRPPEDVQFTPPKIKKGPPPPPKPPTVTTVRFTPPVIVNEKGYAILVRQTKEEPVILLTKKGITQKIRMSVWIAKPEYFENKYGKLPPPPPPVPLVRE